MPDPKVFLSGRFSARTPEVELAWLKRTGCKYRCFSFAFCHPAGAFYTKAVERALHVSEKRKIEIMMDSGAHTIHADKKKDKLDPEELKETMYAEYVPWVKENKDKWAFYVTLDYLRHQPTIFKMQKRFMRDGLRPVPVYHGDSDLTWLKKYRDMGFKFICVGTTAEIRGSSTHRSKQFFLDRVFDFGAKHDIQFHGLAMTSLSVMLQFPWYSVDSSTWARTAAFGMITFLDKDKNIVYHVHISDQKKASKSKITMYSKLDKHHKRMIDAKIADFGFTIDELRESRDARYEYNGKVFSNVFSLIDRSRTMHTNWERLV